MVGLEKTPKTNFFATCIASAACVFLVIPSKKSTEEFELLKERSREVIKGR